MTIKAPPGSPSRIYMRYGCYVMFSISSLVLLARIYIRIFVVKKMGLDDLFVTIAGACNLVIAICARFMFENGIGYHSYDIADEVDLKHLVLWPWISQIFYFFALGCIKTSNIALYLRLAVSTTQRRILWVAFVIMLCQGFISSLIVATILCRPINVIWNGGFWGPKCINVLALNYYNTAINVIADIILVVAPIAVIKGLRMDKKKKAGLYFIVGLGVLAIGGTISRQITNTIAIHKTTDFSWHWALAELCIILELSLGIILVSVPALYPPFGRYLATISCFICCSQEGEVDLEGGEFDLITIGRKRIKKRKPGPSDSPSSDIMKAAAVERGEKGSDEGSMTGAPGREDAIDNWNLSKAKNLARVEQEVRVVEYTTRW